VDPGFLCFLTAFEPRMSGGRSLPAMHFSDQLLVVQHVLDLFAKLLNLPPAYLATQPDGSKGLGGGKASISPA